MIRILLVCLFICLSSHNSDAVVGKPSIGTNLAGQNTYSGDLQYVDRVKHSSSWVNNTTPLTLDANKYPVSVSATEGDGEWASKYLFQNLSNYPGGSYTLKWKGTGTINVRAPCTCPGRANCVITGTDVTQEVVVPTPDYDGDLIQLRLEYSSASDHIREINFIMPGFENVFETAPIHPDYLALMSEFAFLRWMSPLDINHSGHIEDWSDRTVPTAGGYLAEGGEMPWEIVIYYSNILQKDAWINIPHKATDDYVRSLITLLNNTLDPGIHLYIEYSNEVWNSIFEQYDYCRDQGRAAFGQETDAASAVAWFNARRSAQIWQLFADNLTGGRSYTRVISGQGVNSTRASMSLQALADPIKNPTSQRADAVAVAYYFGTGLLDTYFTQNGTKLKDDVTIADVEYAVANDVDYLVDLGEATIYGVRQQGMIDHKNLIRNYPGTRLVGYEGGQSYYVGTGYNQLVKAATAPLAIAISKHPRMREYYNKFLTVFFENGGKEFANFSLMEIPASSGAWGLYDYSGDTTNLYKLMGLRDMMEAVRHKEPIGRSTDGDGAIRTGAGKLRND